MGLKNYDYFLGFHLCEGVGPKTFKIIWDVFEEDVEKAWESEKGVWLDLGFSKKSVDKVFENKYKVDLDKWKKELSKLGIKYLGRDGENFPRLLKEVEDCPIGLFYKGEWDEMDMNCLAVVGTRKITNYGRQVTNKLVTQLCYAGLTIVSGMARGVDGAAHRAAIESDGRTIAVCGVGLDQIYPPEHRNLASDIIQHGLMISEFVPYTKISAGNFPSRNRIVAGMSLGVLVTEGAKKSGSKITARLALDYGREVFAVPGAIDSVMSEAPLELIQMGAKMVVKADDVLEELKLTTPKTKKFRQVGKGVVLEKLVFENANEEKIWNSLDGETRHMDEISRELNLPVWEVSSKLTMMEVKGMVKNLGDGNYMRV
jgi:DNA processing protein